MKTHPFSKINYIGNKQKLVHFIADELPGEGRVLDVFSGGGSVAYELKKRGYAVTANDALYVSHVLSRALIENDDVTLEADVLYAAAAYKVRDLDLSFMDSRLFFPEEVRQLETLAAYSYTLDGYTRDLYLSLLRRAMIRKLPYSRMNVGWENIRRLRDEDYSYQKYGRRRAYHNQPFIDHMREALPHYNAIVHKGDARCLSIQMDALQAVRLHADTHDILYMDPPYPGTMNRYQDFYGGFDRMFGRDVAHADITKPDRFLCYLDDMLKAARTGGMRVAALSFNSKTKPSQTEIVRVLERHGRVDIRTQKHSYQMSGSAEKHSNTEILALTDLS